MTGATLLSASVGSAVALSLSAVAAADPLPPADPPAPVDAIPPAPEPQVTKFGPLGALPASGYGMDLLLGQYPAPGLPGAAPAAGPSPEVLGAGQFLIPSNYRVPTPDQLSPYPLPAGVPGPFARVDGLKGLHAIVHGALGRMPIGELSDPLPGTAPPPGTNIPVGPVQNLPDPDVSVVPAYPGPPPLATAPATAQSAP